MYRLIFYKIKHSTFFASREVETVFSISIESEAQIKTDNSILQASKRHPDIVTIQKPPVKGRFQYLKADTLEEAHYLCMKFGYMPSSKGVSLQEAVGATHKGIHQCGELEADYEAIIRLEKKVQSA